VTTRSHAAFRQLPRKSYRELSDPGLNSQSAPSIHRAVPSTRGLIELDGDDSSSDPIAYGIDDVMKHLRGACGLVRGSDPVVSNQIQDPRKEDDHE
jgi:hypothetical protein